MVFVVTQFSLQSPLGLSINSIPSSSQWRLESEWNEEKRTHDANGHTHFSIESCLFFYYFDFSISRRDQVATREFSSNVKLPRPPRVLSLTVWCLSVSQWWPREKKRERIRRIRRRITRLKNIRNENGILSKRRTAKEETLCLLVCVCI